MVKTGARANALEQLLARVGYKPAAKLPGPRTGDLSPERIEHVAHLYRALGGTTASPRLRPGAWDLAFQGGIVVELDEELHFNRYRRITLEPEWAVDLPWRRDYLTLTAEHEAGC